MPDLDLGDGPELDLDFGDDLAVGAGIIFIPPRPQPPTPQPPTVGELNQS
jgi:hypothetical protein